MGSTCRCSKSLINQRIRQRIITYKPICLSDVNWLISPLPNKVRYKKHQHIIIYILSIWNAIYNHWNFNVPTDPQYYPHQKWQCIPTIERKWVTQLSPQVVISLVIIILDLEFRLKNQTNLARESNFRLKKKSYTMLLAY